jgi:hypothetical protein
MKPRYRHKFTERWFGWWRNPQDRFAFFIAFFTALLFLATVGLWIATRDLVSSSEETAERQLRAYLGVSGNVLGINQDSTRLILDNFGLTPATNVKVFSNWEFLPSGQELPSTFAFENRECADAKPHRPSISILLPRNPITTVRLHCIATDEPGNLQKAQRQELSAYYYGNITYQDIFKKPRRTNLCIIFSISGSGGLYDRHNEIDPDEKGH